ncbi:hypothetical protein HNP33_003045 [Comamonas odontotermitis]|uniref:DNA transfer protein n=1 Tax=Comamonas odontotermitis TaxID=379895 RepID=A0ABR6RIF7_9BURK|nr:hypothetical protein [Comamonas odontotermitis]MBB6578940.1 hypothetical protein [Comamonas odontotermitis]
MSWGIVASAGASIVGGMLADDGSSGRANAASERLNKFGSGLADLYDTTYVPLHQAVAADAMNYDSAENYARAAGDAAATNASEFAKAQSRLTRTPGMDPSSGAYQAGMVGLNLAQAANGAVTQNAARKGVQDTAWTRKTQALGLGNNLAGVASSSLGSGYNSAANQAQANQKEGSAMGGMLGNIVGAFF